MTEDLSLNGEWALRFGPETAAAPDTPAALARSDWPCIPARVPGNVEPDLVRAGRLAPPEPGLNVLSLRELETWRWWYSRAFDPPRLAPGERLELRLEGVDCLATIWVDDRRVGECDNALIPHAFDITDAVTAGRPATIHVRLDSALRAGRRRIPEAVEVPAGLSSRWESLAVRKAPHAYGWDIMPRAPSAGLWRGVALRRLPATRLRSVYWFTTEVSTADSSARVTVDWDFETDRPRTDGLVVVAELADETGVAASVEAPALGSHGRLALVIPNAKPWWPRGYGDPHLYDARVELRDAAGARLDGHACRVGLRTVALDATPLLDADGRGAFRFVVNGVPVFARGTNWTPLDAFHGRDAEHYDAVLPMLAELNCNLVRCWGGNVYEDERFFDFCDAHGILVWQDFALACAVYPQEAAFQRRLYAEAETIVRRLRNHASLALWAGNNENDLVPQWKGLGRYQDPNRDIGSRVTLAEAVRRNDLTRPYLPGSPYVSPAARAAGAPESALPEQHLWGARPFYKDPFYARSRAKFVSEIGYHGCPGRASLEQMLTPGALWPPDGNAEWGAKTGTAHAEQLPGGARVREITAQLCHLFGSAPDRLDDYVLASQLTQLEALKFFIEQWRLKPDGGGILWWNLRDGWPLITDAVVDYYGRRKLAYEAIRRVQADVCVMAAEPEDGTQALVAVNDTRAAARGTVVVTPEDGRPLFAGRFEAGPGARAVIARLPAPSRSDLWLIRWRLDGGAEGINHYLCGPIPLPLETYRRFLPRILAGAGEEPAGALNPPSASR